MAVLVVVETETKGVRGRGKVLCDDVGVVRGSESESTRRTTTRSRRKKKPTRIEVNVVLVSFAFVLH